MRLSNSHGIGLATKNRLRSVNLVLICFSVVPCTISAFADYLHRKFCFSNGSLAFLFCHVRCQSIVVSDASAGSFMVTLDLTASGGSVQTSGEIAYNADPNGGTRSVVEILKVKNVAGAG